jgi:hypothetical protein
LSSRAGRATTTLYTVCDVGYVWTMVMFILLSLVGCALGSLIQIINGLQKLWVGDSSATAFVWTCLVAACMVVEIKAVQWLWALDDRFDLSALAASVGIG